jgi:Polyketide cyclase / dehydrase and lipid transport
MTFFQVEIEINASPELVWAAVRDVERWPEWTHTVTSVRLRTPPPLTVGSRFEPSALKEVKLGDFTIGPKNMPHFGWAKVETTIHVYGVGPFRSTLIDPVYELTRDGTFLLTSLLQPGTPTNSSPPDCFALKVGAHVQGNLGEGTIVEARCSPANHITQYWIQKSDGERFWATLQELQEPIR